jgi:hypothetical protein
MIIFHHIQHQPATLSASPIRSSVFPKTRHHPNFTIHPLVPQKCEREEYLNWRNRQSAVMSVIPHTQQYCNMLPKEGAGKGNMKSRLNTLLRRIVMEMIKVAGPLATAQVIKKTMDLWGKLHRE